MSNEVIEEIIEELETEESVEVSDEVENEENVEITEEIVEETEKTVPKIRMEIKDGYTTGNYAIVGGGKDWVEVDELPTEDTTKLKCYIPVENEDGSIDLMLDEEKYNNLISEQQAEKLAVLKSQKIVQSKTNLEKYLQTVKLPSSCHGAEEKLYSVTSEKQQHLASMILTATMAQQSGLAYQPSWNASGEVCEGWTLAELQQLAMEMEQMVRPLVSKQQMMEVSIQSSTSIEEVEAVDITFGEGV